MAWEFYSDRPIYAQLMEQIQMKIVSGQYPCGEKLPSVRELAMQAAVNPNTMQKAFAELERSGLIVTQRTNGRSVTEDRELIHKIRGNMAQTHLTDFVRSMKKLGFDEPEIVSLVEGLVDSAKREAAAESEEHNESIS
jgi:DNA-binding transcriptional regulator YhcF (GntR family)